MLTLCHIELEEQTEPFLGHIIMTNNTLYTKLVLCKINFEVRGYTPGLLAYLFPEFSPVERFAKQSRKKQPKLSSQVPRTGKACCGFRRQIWKLVRGRPYPVLMEGQYATGRKT